MQFITDQDQFSVFKRKQQKMLAGTWHSDRRYLVWKIEGKAAKLLMTTFAQRSTGYLFCY